jgi:hypothetical protein
MAWQEPKTNWGAGDVPGPGDLNRIEENTRLRVNAAFFNVPGVYNFVVPAGIDTVWVSLSGGGGGGATGVGSGGGGADAKIKYKVNVTPLEQITVTVGSDGAPGAAGGASSFGSHVSAPGGGGASSGAGAPGGPGGQGGDGSGNGGYSIFGNGGIRGNYINGTGYGAGGASNGGRGAPGFVLVEW